MEGGKYMWERMQISMQTCLSRLGHILLAVDQKLDLSTHLSKPAKNLRVPIHKPQDGVWNTRIQAELLDQHLKSPEVVSRYPGEEMMDCLELQTAVDEVEPGGAFDVHRGTQLALWERFALAKVGRGHAPMRQGDLDVKGHGDNVRHQDEGHTYCPGRQRAPEQAVAEDVPIAGHEGDLRRPNPPRLAAAERRRLEESGRRGEKRNVLDVWVMLRMICD